MYATSSELQIPAPRRQDPGDDLNQVSLLRHRVSAREPFASDCFIQEADVCSAVPADLVRDHALGTDLGDGKGTAWYFCSPANYHQTPGSRRRKRKVRGGAGAGETCWHVEKGAPILGADKKSVGAYKRTLSYVKKVKNPPGTAKPFRNKTLGWIMVEIELEQQEDGPDQQLVLCKIYESPRPRTVACGVPGVENMPGVGNMPAVGNMPGIGSMPAVGNMPAVENMPVVGNMPGVGNMPAIENMPVVGKMPAVGNMPCTPAPPPPASKSSSCDDDQLATKECKTTFDSPLAARKPALSIRTAFKPSTRCRPTEGEITSGVAIVKKGSLPAAVTAVMKFGGSSMKSADHMKEMAELVFSFPASGGNPVVVLSAMWNTTTNLLVAAGKALSCGAKEASEIRELAITRETHFRMVDDLGLDRSIVSGSFDELENVFMGIGTMKELTSKTRDYLVSFGENASTRIFSAYLNELGKGTCQEWELYAVNTCRRGGTDLTATTIAREMGAREIQVWKDVDGVLTCDPTVCTNAIPLPYLTFDEAAELGLFGAQSVQLAMEGGISIKVKNSYNLQAPGTMITKTRDTSKSVLTSIVLRSNITVLNIQSTRMVDHSVFLAMSFSIFANFGLSVDCVAISEGKISLIVVPPKLSSREFVQLELDNVVEELQKISVVDRLKDRSVISLIGNAQMSAIILVKAFNVLRSINVEVQKFSQGSSKVMNISLVVDNNKGEDCARALHSEFFEKGIVSEVQGGDQELNGSPVQVPESSHAAAARSGDKRKADDDDHPETPPSVRQERADTNPDDPDETEPQVFSNSDPTTVEGDSPDGALDDFFHSIDNTDIEPVRVDVITPDLTEQANSIALSDIQRLLFHEEDPVLVVEGNSDKDQYREWASLLVDEPEQKAIDEAAEGDDRLRTGTEALLEQFSPEDLLGPSNGDMSCPPPPPFVPS